MRQLVISKSITQREYQSLGKYFTEVDKIDLISINQEVILARKIKAGDQLALEQLTKTNLRFVISVAKQYQNNGLTLGDLISEGNVGLITAAKRYDETKGFRFISYAVWWIRQAILAAIAQHARMVRLPHNQLQMVCRIHKAISVLEQHECRKPTAEELAQYLEISVERVCDLMAKSDTHLLSMDEPCRENEESCLHDMLPTGDPGADCYVQKESIVLEINHSLGVLHKRDRKLLILFFGLGQFEPLSLEEIGRQFGISKEHVGRLKEKALRKLRNCSNAPVLKSCLS
jgi:RNA polymerase primary sigma factor